MTVVRCLWSSVIPPEQLEGGAVAASHLRLGFRATVAGTVGLQHVVPMACGTWSRRSHLAHSSFSKDRERLLNEKVLALFLETLPGMEGVKPLVSSYRFCRRHPAGQGIPQLPQTCGWQHDPGQDSSPPLHQKGGRRRVPGKTSRGRASATAPSQHPRPDAWRVVARPIPPCSAPGSRPHGNRPHFGGAA